MSSTPSRPTRHRRSSRLTVLGRAFVTGIVLATTALTATAAGAAPADRGILPPLPDGLNAAIGKHLDADSGSAPGSALGNAADGDGTSRWCPSTVGAHTLTVDLGRATDITGTGVTFSGSEGSDGSHYSVTTGLHAPGDKPFPHQGPGDSDGIVQGPLYLFAGASGSAADVAATVKARYVTLHFQAPREENLCVQEFRVFSGSAVAAPGLQLGGDLTNLAADDTGSWSAGGTAAPVADILKSGGMNYGRVQLLVDPTDCGTTCASLANGLTVAKRLKAAGMKISLDLEYADTPTSSVSQPTPAAWAGESPSALARTVRSYTGSVVAAFAHNGTPVSEVSIGDDITQGMLWPTGRLTVGGSGRADWSRLTALVAAGVQGVRDGSPRGSDPLIELSLDSGADNTTTVDFLHHIAAARIPFDVIGLAYLPWQQGAFTALKANLDDLAGRFDQRLVVSESQFPYTDVTGYGTYSTAVPYPDTLPGYLISPSGQASYERDLVSLLASLRGGAGLGVFYSSPDTTGGLGLFTADGAAQPGAYGYRIGSKATLYHGGSVSLPSNTSPGDRAGTALPGRVPTAPQPTAAPLAAAPQSATQAPMPAGLDVAIGAKAKAGSGSAPGSSVNNTVDGDGTDSWCPAALGPQTVTVDLGKPTDITGTGLTFSGQQAGDGSSYTVTTGLGAPGDQPFPNQTAGGNTIGQGPLYLFAGSAGKPAATVKARYVTLHYQVPREQSVCVQEFRVFSTDGRPSPDLELGADLSTLISDNATYTLNGASAPILSIFKTGGLNYVRLRLWMNPTGSPASNPTLANDLIMAKQVKAAGMKLLLDFHYSDTWADPQHQNVPTAWAGENLPQLTTSIHDYTQSVVEAFAANGTPVDQVAIGNEITQGTVWAATSVVGGSTTAVAGGSTLTAPAPAGAVNLKVAGAGSFAAGQTVTVGAGAQARSAVVAAVGTATRSTTLAAPVGAGDTVVKVASVTGWAVGDTVTLGAGPNQESATVAALGTAGAAGTGITLGGPAKRAHQTGAGAAELGTGLTLTAALPTAQPQGAAVATVTPKGTSTLRVGSTTGFTPGQKVAVDSSAGQETATVASAGTGTTGATLTFAAPLTRDHAGPFTVATATPAGTTTLKLAATSGIRAGDTLFVDAGANLVPDQLTETAKVAAVGTPGPDGTGVRLAEPLELGHAGAVTVQDVQTSGRLLFDPKTGKADWTSLTTLIKAGAQGAQAGNPAHHPMLIQLHVDRGGDNATTVDWMNHMVRAGVPFDVIGESYYPWYHGPMGAMKANLTDLVGRFHKDVLIAEDQFPQAPQGGYGTYNVADANYPDTLPGYPVTPAGQLSYQRDLDSLVASLPGGRGLGVFYWDGDGQGNLGMFNQQHAAQPVVYANQVGNGADIAD